MYINERSEWNSIGRIKCQPVNFRPTEYPKQLLQMVRDYTADLPWQGEVVQKIAGLIENTTKASAGGRFPITSHSD